MFCFLMTASLICNLFSVWPLCHATRYPAINPDTWGSLEFWNFGSGSKLWNKNRTSKMFADCGNSTETENIKKLTITQRWNRKPEGSLEQCTSGCIHPWRGQFCPKQKIWELHLTLKTWPLFIISNHLSNKIVLMGLFVEY